MNFYRLCIESVRTAAAVAAAVLMLASPARAAEQVVPVGTVIDKTNIDKYRDYFSPGVVWTIEHDVSVRVGPYKKIERPELTAGPTLSKTF